MRGAWHSLSHYPFRLQPTRYLFHYQAVRHKLPEVFHHKGFHAVFGFDGVQLAVATVAGHNYHGCAGCLNLLHFFSAVKNSFGIIAGCQCSAAPAAAILVALGGVQIHPVGHALVQDPSGFIVESLPEQSARTSGRSCRDHDRQPDAADRGFVQADSSGFLKCKSIRQIKDRECAKCFQKFRIPFFKTRPGRKIGVPSLRPHEIFGLKPVHVFHNPADHDLHGSSSPVNMPQLMPSQLSEGMVQSSPAA